MGAGTPMTTRWKQRWAVTTQGAQASYETARQKVEAELAEQARWKAWHNPLSERCHGLTQRGARCGQLARKYGDYCYIHYQDQGYDPAAEGWAEHTNPYHL